MRLLASGRDSDVYVEGDGLVRRRYRDGRDAGAEADLLRELERHGYPVPRVTSQAGPDIVMTRVGGPTLTVAVQTGLLDPTTGGELLADLHRRLHALTRIGDTALLHLDLHPANVLLGDDGPVVIDWCNARRGPADLDVALTALILAQVVVTPGLVSADPVEDSAVRAFVPDLLAGYLGRVPGRYVDHLDEAAELRRADPHHSVAELTALADAVALARSLRPTPSR